MLTTLEASDGPAVWTVAVSALVNWGVSVLSLSGEVVIPESMRRTRLVAWLGSCDLVGMDSC